MDSSRPDVVFDCNVLVQAICRSNGPAAGAFRLIEQNRITLYLSKAMLREFRRTMAYPEIRDKNPYVTGPRIDAFIAHLLFRGVLCRDVPHVFDLPRDHDDEVYLDLAAAIGADYLVTRDNDLLSLMADHRPIGNEFRQRFPRLRILNPVDFLTSVP